MADVPHDNEPTAPPHHHDVWTMIVENLTSKSQFPKIDVESLIIEDYVTSKIPSIDIETPDKMKFMPRLPTIGVQSVNPHSVTKTWFQIDPETYPIFHHIPNFVTHDPNNGLQNINNDSQLEFNPAQFMIELDCFFGAFLILLTIIGLCGNITSFSYFWKRRKKTIHDFLYMLISAVDGLTSMTSLPVITSLLNFRAPSLFDTEVICKCWPIAFYLLIRVSMFLVIIVSVTRALAIVKPLTGKHAGVQPKYVIVGMIAYCLLLLTIDLVYVLSGRAENEKMIKFIKKASFCEILSAEKLDLGGPEVGLGWKTSLYLTLLHLELLLPCVVVFVSFLVSTISLLKRKTMKSEDEKNFRRISVTIAIFTALFLICYLPCFVLQMVYLINLFNVKVALLEQGSMFLQYGHLVIQFILPQLNTAVNPCLYFTRMPRFRKWLKRCCIKPKLIDTTRNIEANELNLAEGKVGGDLEEEAQGSEQTHLLRSDQVTSRE